MSNDGIEIRDLRQQEWVWTSKAVLFSEYVDGNAYKVYSGLASYADNRTQESFPSIMTLAKRLHIGRTTIIKALQVLEDTGFIAVERREGLASIYSLLRVVEDKPVRLPHTKVAPASAGPWVKETLQWAEARKSAKFVNYGKQIGALGAMSKAGYSLEDIKGCYVMMEQDEFWRSRGFDFTNVANEIPKKINTIRQKHGTPAFEHLVNR